MKTKYVLILITGIFCLSGCGKKASDTGNLALNSSGYFEKRGLNVLVFSNMYDATFDDSKISALEIIQHGVRVAANGDVRLNPTPGQWDPIARFVERKVDSLNNRIDVKMNFADYGFAYTLTAEAKDNSLYFSVNTDAALPDSLVGIAGLNIEFFPPVYWGHSWSMDGQPGYFPVSPADIMTTINGQFEPRPIAAGKCLEIAPDEPLKHITIASADGSDIMLFDGRNKQQNGTFTVRTLLPAGKTGRIAEWKITVETVSGWTREPVIAYSQAGYHPDQKKIAVIELDKNDRALSSVSLLKVNPDGSRTAALKARPAEWGLFTRYNYLQFDFSAIKETGIYLLKYGDVETSPFPIANDVYQKTWYPTLDVFMPVQMDHIFVREGYRVWHGAAHLDDALQAPLNRIHWDGWRQGPVTGNRFKPLQHIPGLNVGGWFDAGDFDIQTPSQESVVQRLVQVWETFRLDRDETTVNQKDRYVEIHAPDGIPDVLQQIEHGALQLAAQVKSIGYAIPGINESHLYQYRHLGDALTKTDGVVQEGAASDDRWAFTNHSPSLNYSTVVSLAGAARTLKDCNPKFADECLSLSEFVWKDEHSRPVESQEGQPFFIRDFTVQSECQAAFQLWRTTGKTEYKARFDELLQELKKSPEMNLALFANIAPFMDDDFKQWLKPTVKQFADRMAKTDSISPFGVMIIDAGWAGNGQIISGANLCFDLYRLYPDLIDTDFIFRALDYIYGCHPVHNLSFVSGVGVQPKRVAYGNNRADFTFIPGGIVPGVRILKPDFPENRDDYPFLWSENEYVIGIAPEYIYLVNAANYLLGDR
ncbi:MAG: glycoside hydrolase family 9 protein [Dysgonamonadaceae bacterium]|nr:glycoside hydrolase family 9 protein [Dysgonamonadaceae bacterium]